MVEHEWTLAGKLNFFQMIDSKATEIWFSALLFLFEHGFQIFSSKNIYVSATHF